MMTTITTQTTRNDGIHEFDADDCVFVWKDNWMRVFEDATQIFALFHEDFHSDEEVYQKFWDELNKVEINPEKIINLKEKNDIEQSGIKRKYFVNKKGRSFRKEVEA